jgi:tetratricopeptide (TPR) repeat protein
MDQLVALQEIYESFSAGREGLQSIDPKEIEGRCPDLVARLLKAGKKGSIDEEVCQKLLECLQDVYELKRLGDICSQARLFDLAANCYDKALSLNRDQMVGPILLNNLGQVYARKGDPEKSTFFYQKAAQDFELLGNQRSLAHVTGNLASLYRQSKSWNKALEHNQRSLEIFEQLGDDYGRAQMTGSLGRIYAEMGETDLAVKHLEESIREFQRLGDKKSGARVLDRLGRVEAERKDWDSAFKHFHRSLSLLEELGETKLAGVVLSDQGWAFLEKGEPGAARESLERALKLMGREMQPAYQNALARLAAACGTLGREYSLTADESQSSLARANREAEEKLKLASQYFARASDRYLELASFSEIEIPDIKIVASLNRFLSYLYREEASGSDEEAVALAERGISALDSAVANAREEERARIQGLQRVLAGMKEVRAISLMGNEPWRLMKAVSNSIEYLLGAACLTAESGYLCDALRDLSASMEEERRRKSPLAKLREAAAHLRQAEKRFEEQGEKGNAMKIGEAAVLIESVIDVEASAQPSVSRTAVLNYKAHRNALLLIGWVLMSSALSQVDRFPRVFTWDSSLHLVTESRKEAPREKSLPKSSPPSRQPAALAVHPKPPMQEIFEHAVKSAEEIVEVVNKRSSLPAEAVLAQETRAVPAEANLLPSSPPPPLLLTPEESKRFEVIESLEGKREIKSEELPPKEARVAEVQRFEVVESLGGTKEVKSEEPREKEERVAEGYRFEGQEVKFDEGAISGGEAELSLDQMPYESPDSLFSNGIKSTLSIRLLKALLAIVLVLLGIDVILHLI